MDGIDGTWRTQITATRPFCIGRRVRAGGGAQGQRHAAEPRPFRCVGGAAAQGGGVGRGAAAAAPAKAHAGARGSRGPGRRGRAGPRGAAALRGGDDARRAAAQGATAWTRASLAVLPPLWLARRTCALVRRAYAELRQCSRGLRLHLAAKLQWPDTHASPRVMLAALCRDAVARARLVCHRRRFPVSPPLQSRVVLASL